MDISGCTISRDISVMDINIGQVFEGRIGEYSGVFLRIYDEVVYLEDPQKVWGKGAMVRNYTPRKATVHLE